MAYATIDKGSKYFNTKLYTGNNSTSNSITGVGFQPDWVWIKRRSGGLNDNVLFDSVRGATKRLISNATSAETTNTDTLSAFNTDGFTVNINDTVNASSPYVAWNWLANNTSGSSNTAGTITSTVSANTTSGFSIVSYTGNGSNSTVGHGLGATPKMFIVKNRSITETWRPYHVALGGGQALALNDVNATDTDSSYWSNTNPTSSVFTVGTNTGTNGSGNSMIAYCFADVKGYSKFGSYTGNGNADGTFVYLGFRPAFVMRKRTDTTADWRIDDSKRDGYNVIPHTLFPNYDNEETTSSFYRVDLLSNGFKCRGTSANQNTSGGTYIYMAFAENPFVSSKGIPTTAR